MIQVTIKDVNTGEEITTLALDFIPQIKSEITLWEDGKRILIPYQVVKIQHDIPVDGYSHGLSETTLLVTPIKEPVVKT